MTSAPCYWSESQAGENVCVDHTGEIPLVGYAVGLTVTLAIVAIVVGIAIRATVLYWSMPVRDRPSQTERGVASTRDRYRR